MAKIEKIVLEIGGKKIELSPDEAKELKDALSDMFGQTVYIPGSPIYIERWPKYKPWRGPHWVDTPRWETGTITLTASNTG